MSVSECLLIVESHAFFDRRLVDPVAIGGGRLVGIAERDAEQHLQRRIDAQQLADRVGVEAEHRLRYAAKSVRRQRQQQRLSVHSDVASHSHIVAKGRHEQQRGVRRTKKFQVVSCCGAAIFGRFARNANRLIVGRPLRL